MEYLGSSIESKPDESLIEGRGGPTRDVDWLIGKFVILHLVSYFHLIGLWNLLPLVQVTQLLIKRPDFFVKLSRYVFL